MAEEGELRDAISSFLREQEDWCTIDTVRAQVEKSVPDIEPGELEDALQMLIWEGEIDTVEEDGVVSYRIELEDPDGEEE